MSFIIKESANVVYTHKIFYIKVEDIEGLFDNEELLNKMKKDNAFSYFNNNRYIMLKEKYVNYCQNNDILKVLIIKTTYKKKSSVNIINERKNQHDFVEDKITEMKKNNIKYTTKTIRNLYYTYIMNIFNKLKTSKRIAYAVYNPYTGIFFIVFQSKDKRCTYMRQKFAVYMFHNYKYLQEVKYKYNIFQKNKYLRDHILLVNNQNKDNFIEELIKKAEGMNEEPLYLKNYKLMFLKAYNYSKNYFIDCTGKEYIRKNKKTAKKVIEELDISEEYVEIEYDEEDELIENVEVENEESPVESKNSDEYINIENIEKRPESGNSSNDNLDDIERPPTPLLSDDEEDFLNITTIDGEQYLYFNIQNAILYTDFHKNILFIKIKKLHKLNRSFVLDNYQWTEYLIKDIIDFYTAKEKLENN